MFEQTSIEPLWLKTKGKSTIFVFSMKACLNRLPELEESCVFNHEATSTLLQKKAPTQSDTEVKYQNLPHENNAANYAEQHEPVIDS